MHISLHWHAVCSCSTWLHFSWGRCEKMVYWFKTNSYSHSHSPNCGYIIIIRHWCGLLNSNIYIYIGIFSKPYSLHLLLLNLLYYIPPMHAQVVQRQWRWPNWWPHDTIMATHHPTLDTKFAMSNTIFFNIFIEILSYTTKAICKQSTDYAALCSILTSHYLNQRWPSLLMHIFITRPQWVNHQTTLLKITEKFGWGLPTPEV